MSQRRLLISLESRRWYTILQIVREDISQRPILPLTQIRQGAFHQDIELMDQSTFASAKETTRFATTALRVTFKAIIEKVLHANDVLEWPPHMDADGIAVAMEEKILRWQWATATWRMFIQDAESAFLWTMRSLQRDTLPGSVLTTDIEGCHRPGCVASRCVLNTPNTDSTIGGRGSYTCRIPDFVWRIGSTTFRTSNNVRTMMNHTVEIEQSTDPISTEVSEPREESLAFSSYIIKELLAFRLSWYVALRDYINHSPTSPGNVFPRMIHPLEYLGLMTNFQQLSESPLHTIFPYRSLTERSSNPLPIEPADTQLMRNQEAWRKAIDIDPLNPKNFPE